MRILRLITVLLAIFSASLALADNGTKTLLILPFENTSKTPGLDWISEAIPEVLSEGMETSGVYVVPREDRNYAFERMGVPTGMKLSRATLYRISEQMDADYVVLGTYGYDGETFTTHAQLLDMKKLRLVPEGKESGPLAKMVEIQRSLSWDLLRELSPESLPSKQEFLAGAEPVRLDAFENYIRGLLAITRKEKVERFRDAVRLSPNYSQAMYQLGRTYYSNKEYESAAAWFSRVPESDTKSGAANFYLGISSYYTGNYETAEKAFQNLVNRFPFPEVNNNLGVVLGRRGKRSEIEYLQKAVNTDPNNADFHFNLAVAYARIFDRANAVRQLRETLRVRPNDSEAKNFLALLNSSGASSGSAVRTSYSASIPKLPAQRIQENYDENSYRQLAMEIVRAANLRLAQASPQEQAAFHVERGDHFLTQDFISEAQDAFRKAIVLDPANAAAHVGLAEAYEKDGKLKEAVAEAQAALRLQPSATALLMLARQNLKDNKLNAASVEVERALELEPHNEDAQKLQKAILEKLAAARN